MNIGRQLFTGLLSAGTALAVPVTVLAQTAPATPPATEPKADNSGEIVVTAQKREQREFDVPMAISAISAGEIAARGASAIEDLVDSVPGLAITEYAPGQQRAILRGISDYAGLPTVGVYLDEVPLSTDDVKGGQDVRLIDIDRIEVLRGPQGTLYGQGAMGGTIRYITGNPDLDHASGTASGEVASIDHGGVDWRGNGVINLPIVPGSLALRVAGGYQRFGGWVDDTTLGANEINSGDTYLIRSKLLWQPIAALKISLLYSHQQLDLGALNASDANLQIAQSVPSANGQKVDIGNATASYALGGATLLSSTSYLDRRDRVVADVSPIYVPALDAALGLPAGLLQSVSLGSRGVDKIFTQEMRLSSDDRGPFNWTIGGTYRNSDYGLTSASTIVPDILPVQLSASDAINRSRSWAIFGEARYRLTSTVEATIGGRYFEDRRSLAATSVAFGAPSTDSGAKTFRAFSPKINVLWQATDELNLYANAAKGFRSGGFNQTSAGMGLVVVPPAYDPETLWSYEAGAKFLSHDRRIEGEVAVYRNQWNNAQSTEVALGGLVPFTTNGGKLSGWGADAQLTVRPVRGLTLTTTGGWNGMAYHSTTADHLPGDPADYVPGFAGSASAEYRFRWSSALGGLARIDYQHSAAYQVFIRDAMLAPARSQATDQVNVRLGAQMTRWDVSVFARNLLDSRTIVAPALGAQLYPIYNQPRTIGIAGSVRF